MGYSGISGAADKALATMMHFGLLERTGKGEVRISQAAVDILHPDSEAQRKQALYEAAYRPQLFSTLRARFPEGASGSTLKSFLVRENFLDRAIAPALSSYEDTCSYLKQEGAYESRGLDGDEAEESSLDDFEDTEVEAIVEEKKRVPPPKADADIPAGMRKFVINLPNGGDAILAYPAGLTAEGYQDLQDYLDLFFKKAKRQPPSTPDDGSAGL